MRFLFPTNPAPILFFLLQIYYLDKQLSRGKRRLTLLQKFVLFLFRYLVPFWKPLLFVFKPAALLSTPHQLSKKFWGLISKQKGRNSKCMSEEVIRLIREMAQHNPWGAERIKNELIILGFKVSKRTVQKYLNQIKRPSGNGGRWKTFLENHKDQIIQTDFTAITPIWNCFKPIQLLFFISMKTRKIVHFNLTTNPDSNWVIQQFKEASPFSDPHNPPIFIHDRDGKFKINFQKHNIKHVQTSFRSPNMNSYIERFMKTIKTEALNHIFTGSESELRRVVREYIEYYNHFRTHQGLMGKIPETLDQKSLLDYKSVPGTRVLVRPILKGLHHHYILAA